MISGGGISQVYFMKQFGIKAIAVSTANICIGLRFIAKVTLLTYGWIITATIANAAQNDDPEPLIWVGKVSQLTRYMTLKKMDRSSLYTKYAIQYTCALSSSSKSSHRWNMKIKEIRQNATVLRFRLLSKKNVKKEARAADDPQISPLLSVSYPIVATEGAKYIQQMMKFNGKSGKISFLKDQYLKRSTNQNAPCFQLLFKVMRYLYFRQVIYYMVTVGYRLFNLAILFKLQRILYPLYTSKRFIGVFSTKKNAPIKISKAGMPNTQAYIMVQSFTKQKVIASTMIPTPQIELSAFTQNILDFSLTTSVEKQQMDWQAISVPAQVNIIAMISIQIDLKQPLRRVHPNPRSSMQEAAISNSFLPIFWEKAENMTKPINPAMQTREVSMGNKDGDQHLKSCSRSSASEMNQDGGRYVIRPICGDEHTQRLHASSLISGHWQLV